MAKECRIKVAKGISSKFFEVLSNFNIILDSLSNFFEFTINSKLTLEHLFCEPSQLHLYHNDPEHQSQRSVETLLEHLNIPLH